MASNKERVGLLLVGPPTSAKSSLASQLGENCGIKVIRGRDVMPELTDRFGSFRQLIPDDIFLPHLLLILDGLKSDVIFDNIPRTEQQAVTLLRWARQQQIRLQLIKLNLSLEQVLERVEERMVCPQCGETFHPKLKAPHVPGKCDKDGKTLIKRQGDMSQSIVVSGYNAYMNLIEKLVSTMRKEVDILQFDASGTVEETFALVASKLNAILKVSRS